MLELGKSAQSFLDWYVANHPTASGESQFTDYFNVKENIERELPPRTDEISQLLDLWEKRLKTK
jgi:hypothetical protein